VRATPELALAGFQLISPEVRVEVPDETAKDTSRAAVCLVFEKVNTGGKALDAFELVTAMYAGKKFHLRDDWKVRRNRLLKQPVLANVEPVEFLQAISLLHTKAVRAKAESRDATHRRSAQPATACCRFRCRHTSNMRIGSNRVM